MKKSTSPFDGLHLGEGFQLEAGTLIKDRYKIEEKIGEGGCGTVFRAFDTLQKNQLALKFLNPAVIADRKKFLRVLREINLAQKITDERIVKVFHLDKWNSYYFLVMELVVGKSLKELFEEKKLFSWEEFKPIYFEILDGVNVLHRHGIIHRDIKPSNIIVSEQNKIKILDFGLAKEITDKEKTSSWGEIVGAPFYMSPEQASGEELDSRSDIFSLGMILYRALTEEHPLGKYRTLEIINNYMQGKPIKLALGGKNIPGFIKIGIKMALEQKERRFPSIDAMKRYLSKEKATFRDRLLANSHIKQIRIAAVGLLVAVLFALFYLGSGIVRGIDSIEVNGNILCIKTKSDGETQRKDFSPYIITHAYLDSFKSFHDSIVVFLKHPQNNSFSPSESLSSVALDSKMVFLDYRGNEVYNRSLIEASNMETYDFARISEITFIERQDIDKDGKEETIFNMRQSRGMYPNAICVLKGGELFSFSHPGHIISCLPIAADNQTITFITAGQNNILSHLSFFSELNWKSKKRLVIKGFPYFETENDNIFREFLVFLPRKAILDNVINNNWKNGGISLSDFRGGNRIYVDRDFSLAVRNEIHNIKRTYRDKSQYMKEVYRLINAFYREKNLNHNLQAAYLLISQAFEFNVENPFLKSALYYFKGDLEVLMGKYKEGEEDLLKAIEIHPGNDDPIHRLCEIEFLKGNPLKAIEKMETEYPHAKNFWGLGSGHLLFKSYCYLHVGKFEEADVFYSQIVDRAHQESARCFKGMGEIFKGNYQAAFSDLEVFEKKFVYILTVLELRLLISRARLLAEKGLAQAQFYFEDILEFSKTKKHLAAISAAYLRARDGNTSEAEPMVRSAFEKLLQLSKGDFETRLWLFYDAYIYGKAMELCGNIPEAVRGYRECINANPYTDLAGKSIISLQRLETTFAPVPKSKIKFSR